MTTCKFTAQRQSGFTLLEVLIALIVIVLGLLGLAGMQVRMQQAEFESYQRTQALLLLYDMVDRININRDTASCFAITTNTTNGTPYLGKGSAAVTACAAATAAKNAMADTSISEWDNLLKGASETKGGVSVGALLDARGCVTYDSATELTDAGGTVLSGTGIYTTTVVWQGTVDTSAPTVNCANTLYGAGETLRRAVSTTFRLGYLN